MKKNFTSKPKRYGSSTRSNYNRKNYSTKRVDSGYRASSGSGSPSSPGSSSNNIDAITRQINAIKRSDMSKSQKNRRIKQVLDSQKYDMGQRTEQVKAKGHAYSQTIASTGASITPAVIANGNNTVPAIKSANKLIGAEENPGSKDENTTDQTYGDPR